MERSVRCLEEAIEELNRLTRWDKNFWLDVRSWPELANLINCAQDLGEDDVDDSRDPQFPGEVDFFLQALRTFLEQFAYKP